MVMESPHLGGEFSLGLGLVMSEIVRLLWLELKVAGIKFIPNNAAEFLQKKKSVSDTETKRYIQSLFPDIQFRKIKMHAVDALLFCLMGAPKFYKQILGIETRRLDVTVEQTHLIYG